LEKKHGLLHDRQMAPQWNLQEQRKYLHLIIDPELKEQSIRTPLSQIGFDQEKNDLKYSIRDRREKRELAILQPTWCRDLQTALS